MITEKDLQEAIAECNGTRNPTANTCIKLASYYIIQDKLFPKEQEEKPSYSYAPPPVEQVENVFLTSDTEFSRVVRNKDLQDVLDVIDELMSTLEIVYPKLYQGVLNKLKETG